MPSKTILFVPGKNPKPPPEQHQQLLWRTLLEGVCRASPSAAQTLQQQSDIFKLVAWNALYYDQVKDINRDLPWIDELLNKHGPTDEDIAQAQHWHRKLDRALFTIADHFHFIIRFLPKPVHNTILETNRYFENHNNIACEVRELLKKQLRSLSKEQQDILLIGHSLGSIIAYDTLWELTHEEHWSGKVDIFLTLGSPLGMNYVQRRIQGYAKKNAERYPAGIKKWINVASTGDITALDREFSDDFQEMIKLGLIETIEDYCKGIFNFYHNEKGLNCHRSYGYLVNPAVGKVVGDWWEE